jgi:hypothetical protein
MLRFLSRPVPSTIAIVAAVALPICAIELAKQSAYAYGSCLARHGSVAYCRLIVSGR